MAAIDDVEMEAYRLLVEPEPPRDSRPASKMKPNTRFLRHIVREANHHNAVLLAKETADSQRRLKNLMRNNGKDSTGDGDDDDEYDDTSSKSRDGYGRDSKQKKAESTREDDRHSKKSSRRSDHDRHRYERESRDDKDSHSHRHRRNKDDQDDQDDQDGQDNLDDRDDKSRRHKSHHSLREHHSRSRERNDRHRSSKHRRRSRSPEREREGRLSRSPDCKYRDRSPHMKHRSRHHDEKESTSRTSSGRDRKGRTKISRTGRHSKRVEFSEPSRSRPRSESRSGSDGGSGSSESDPLDDFVGPRLASDNARADKDRIRIRGRGAFSAAALGGLGSSIDRHFAADYDPSADVEMQTESTALQPPTRTGGGSSSGTTEDARTEMQRDRKQLLRDGAERLRAAGFTDKEIAIWSRGGRREVADVPWAKKGEAREWDRGKKEGDDGPAKPLWAR